MAYIKDFIDAYIECALWSSTDSRWPCFDCPDANNTRHGMKEICAECNGTGICEDENYPKPLDENFDADDLGPETRAQMEKDCIDFIWHNRAMLRASKLDAGQAGHDFWLTRCGHGAGYWARGLPDEIGDALTAAAHTEGNVDLYVGDDLKVHSL